MGSSELSRDEIVKAALDKIAESVMEESRAELDAAVIEAATSGNWHHTGPVTGRWSSKDTPYEVSFHTETGEWRVAVKAAGRYKAIQEAVSTCNEMCKKQVLHYFSVRDLKDPLREHFRISVEGYIAWLSSQASAGPVISAGTGTVVNNTRNSLWPEINEAWNKIYESTALTNFPTLFIDPKDPSA